MKWYWKSKKAGFGKTKCLTNPRKSEENSPIPWVELGTQQKSLLPNVSGAIRRYSPSKLLPEQEFLPQISPFFWQIGGHVSQPSLSSLTWWVTPKHESDPKANQLSSCEVNGALQMVNQPNVVILRLWNWRKKKRRVGGGHPKIMKILDIGIRISDD